MYLCTHGQDTITRSWASTRSLARWPGDEPAVPLTKWTSSRPPNCSRSQPLYWHSWLVFQFIATRRQAADQRRAMAALEEQASALQQQAGSLAATAGASQAMAEALKTQADSLAASAAAGREMAS